MAGEVKPKGNREALIYGVMILAVLALFFLIPLLLAALLVKLVGRRLKLSRVELSAIMCLALFAVMLDPIGNISSYGSWLFSIVGVSKGIWYQVPWLDVLSMTVLFAAAYMLLMSTSLNGTVEKTLAMVDPRRRRSTTILPNDKEKRNAEQVIVAAPGQSLTIDAIVHAPDSEATVGKRRFPIGISKYGEPVTLGEDEIRTHALIFGATGSGKSETIKVIAGGLMDLGWDGMILDLKEDAATGGLMDWCSIYSDAHAIPYQEFHITDPSPRFWFSPLHGMGPDEARDTILASQEFEAAYYRALNEKQLGQLVTLLYAVHEIDPVRYPTPNVYDIGKILAAPDLPKATREMVALLLSSVAGFEKMDFDALISPDKAMSEAAGGLGARLTAMYNTKVGRNALRPGESREQLDVTSSGLTYIGLSSGSMPEITQLVSAAVLRRMAVYAADRSTGKVRDRKPRFLIVDEANFVSRRLLLELLSRARSAGISCMVCTQGPTDWESRIPGEPDLRSLAQNTNISMIMRQGELTNAELCADIIGREEKTVYTQQFNQEGFQESGSARTEIDHLVGPDDLRELGIGELIMRVDSPRTWVSWVKVVVRDPKSQPRSSRLSLGE